ELRVDRRGPGQGEDEARPGGHDRRDVEVAAHRPGKFAGDWETEPGAGDPLVPGHPVVRLEHASAVVRPDTRPVVPDRDEDARTVEPGSELDATARRGELQRVGGDVGEDLLHSTAVRDRRPETGR